MEVKSICIAGGGTSGWAMALAILKKIPEVPVTLVESSKIGPIGVGEATQPLVQDFFNEYLGLEEQEWMRETDAIYKVGGVFRNFNTLENGDEVHHTFWTDSEDNTNIYEWGVKKAILADIPYTDYARTFYAAPGMIDEGKFSKREGRTWYASHLDANKFAEYAKNKCSSRITHVIGSITEVTRGEQGIETLSVDTEEGLKILQADLFIDCTGFRAKLIKDAMGSEFKDMTKVLPNDMAVAVRVPYSDKETQLKGFTNCQALTSGWAWTSPLWARIGSGYVFSTKFITPEKALEEFKEYLYLSHDKSLIDGLEFSFLPMRVGYTETPWVKNCVAIGLSSQFVEPLESTGLLFVISSIQEIIRLLKSNDLHHTELARSRYQKYSKELFDEAFQFVLLHYLNTKRTDTPYWRHISNNIKTEPFVLNFISQIEKGDWDLELSKIFPRISWEHILVGFNIIDVSYGVQLDNQSLESYGNTVPPKAWEILDSLSNTTYLNAKEVQEMPTLYQYLKDNIYG